MASLQTESEKIVENLHFLAKHTGRLYKIMSLLVDEGVLTSRERNSIMMLPDSYAKACDLYNQMAEKGEKTCRILMMIWTKTGNDELAKKVKTSKRRESIVGETESSQITSYQMTGEKNDFLKFICLPSNVQSMQKLLTKVEFTMVQIDAHTFPQAIEKCTNLQKLTLSKVKISNIFTVKISLPCLKEFYLDVVEGTLKYTNSIESIQYIIFFDTRESNSIDYQYDWEWGDELNRIYRLNCDVTVAFDGKILLQSMPRKKVFGTSLSDSYSILKYVTSDLEKLSLSRVQMFNRDHPLCYNFFNNLTELVLHHVVTKNLASTIQSCNKLRVLRILAKDHQDINICHLPPKLIDLSLHFVNISYSPEKSFSLDSAAFDFCTFSNDVLKNFHKIFVCQDVFIGGEGALFAPDHTLLKNILKMGNKLQRIWLSGFSQDSNDYDDTDESLVSQVNEFIELSGVPRNSKSFTMQVINGCWKGIECDAVDVKSLRFQMFSLNCFWAKEAYLD